MTARSDCTADDSRLPPADGDHPPAGDAPTTLDAAVLADWREIDDPGEGRRWSTWAALERSCRGPRPWPPWLVTDASAIDTDIGILKTGKEAVVVLVERASATDPPSTVVLAAKRYRSESQRDFHRATTYTEGRSVRNTRDTRALSKMTAHGRALAAGQWTLAEWSFLTAFHAEGLPVPYPVQIDGTEIMMELVCDDAGDPAPRLAHARLARRSVAIYWEQVRDAVLRLARLGYAHGDLSAYNILAAGDRLVLIDLPQAVDIVGNPAGLDFLRRDCMNVGTWFSGKGYAVDGETLFGEAVGYAFAR